MAIVQTKLTNKISALMAGVCVAMTCVVPSGAALAQDRQGAPVQPGLTAGEQASYADLVAMADRSELVIRAKIRRQTQLKPERAPDVAPGFARLYIEADTLALIAGSKPVGEALAYLVDVPLTARGKVPKLKKQEVLLFARTVPGSPGSIQLAGNEAQFAYSGALEERLRPVLTALLSPQAPPVVTGIADALAVPGTLVGESETQVFLNTNSGAPVSITVTRRPNQSPQWGVSWGEIIDSSASAPARDTLRWYRLACALPDELPSSANLARDPAARRLAAQDYAFVLDALGPCTRRVTDRKSVV